MKFCKAMMLGSFVSVFSSTSWASTMIEKKSLSKEKIESLGIRLIKPAAQKPKAKTINDRYQELVQDGSYSNLEIEEILSKDRHFIPYEKIARGEFIIENDEVKFPRLGSIVGGFRDVTAGEYEDVSFSIPSSVGQFAVDQLSGKAAEKIIKTAPQILNIEPIDDEGFTAVAGKSLMKKTASQTVSFIYDNSKVIGRRSGYFTVYNEELYYVDFKSSSSYEKQIKQALSKHMYCDLTCYSSVKEHEGFRLGEKVVPEYSASWYAFEYAVSYVQPAFEFLTAEAVKFYVGPYIDTLSWVRDSKQVAYVGEVLSYVMKKQLEKVSKNIVSRSKAQVSTSVSGYYNSWFATSMSAPAQESANSSEESLQGVVLVDGHYHYFHIFDLIEYSAGS